MGVAMILGVWLCVQLGDKTAYALACILVLTNVTNYIWGNQIAAAAYWLGRSIRDIGGW
jgi:hypothetical protein